MRKTNDLGGIVSIFGEDRLSQHDIGPEPKPTAGMRGLFQVALALAFFGSLAVWSEAGVFRAACVKIEITPDQPQMLAAYGIRQSSGAHDPLFHRILVLDDGETRFVLVSTDVIGISPAFYVDVAEELYRETGVAPDRFWWTATHTHSAPFLGPMGILEMLRPAWVSELGLDPNRDYSLRTRQRLLEGIRSAISRLESARLGVGTGWSFANINRRPLDVDGNISFGKNPDGPVDRQIGLLRIDRSNGSPLALVASYPMHATVLGGANLDRVSADAPGIVAEFVEQQWGAPLLYVNGAAGNLSPIYEHLDFSGDKRTEANLKALMQFRSLIGDRILAAAEPIKCTPRILLRAEQILVETPLKEGVEWPAALAQAKSLSPDGRPLIRLPVRFLEIGEEILIWSLPVELFVEIALQVRQRSPVPFTFYFGYCNGLFGYLPTSSAFDGGGYEPTTSPFTRQAEGDVVRAVLDFFQTLEKRKGHPGP